MPLCFLGHAAPGWFTRAIDNSHVEPYRLNGLIRLDIHIQ